MLLPLKDPSRRAVMNHVCQTKVIDIAIGKQLTKVITCNHSTPLSLKVPFHIRIGDMRPFIKSHLARQVNPVGLTMRFVVGVPVPSASKGTLRTYCVILTDIPKILIIG